MPQVRGQAVDRQEAYAQQFSSILANDLWSIGDGDQFTYKAQPVLTNENHIHVRIGQASLTKWEAYVKLDEDTIASHRRRRRGPVVALHGTAQNGLMTMFNTYPHEQLEANEPWAIQLQ